MLFADGESTRRRASSRRRRLSWSRGPHGTVGVQIDHERYVETQLSDAPTRRKLVIERAAPQTTARRSGCIEARNRVSCLRTQQVLCIGRGHRPQSCFLMALFDPHAIQRGRRSGSVRSSRILHVGTCKMFQRVSLCTYHVRNSGSFSFFKPTMVAGFETGSSATGQRSWRLTARTGLAKELGNPKV